MKIKEKSGTDFKPEIKSFPDQNLGTESCPDFGAIYVSIYSAEKWTRFRAQNMGTRVAEKWARFRAQIPAWLRRDFKRAREHLRSDLRAESGRDSSPRIWAGKPAHNLWARFRAQNLGVKSRPESGQTDGFNWRVA